MSVTPGFAPREPAESPGLAAQINEERAAANVPADVDPFTAPEFQAPAGLDPQETEGLVWPEPPQEADLQAPIETPSSIEGDPTWQDYGRLLAAGGSSIGAGVGWILEKLGADEVGGAIKQRGLESARSWMEDRLEVIGLDTEGLSDQARVALEQELLGESVTGDAKFNKIKLLAAGSLL